MTRMLVRHHHESHSTTGRHMMEKLFHGFQPAVGGADADDQKPGGPEGRIVDGVGVSSGGVTVAGRRSATLLAALGQELPFWESFVPQPQSLFSSA